MLRKRVSCDPQLETELVFAGFAAFLDPPKESAGATISALKASGVSVKILTGDDEQVTRHLCTELKIPIEGVLRISSIHVRRELSGASAHSQSR